VKWLRIWWRQPERFDWLSEYLASRHLQNVARIAYIIALFIIAALPALTLLGAPPSTSVVARGLLGLALVGVLACAAFWLRISWPTRRQSIYFSTTLALLIAIDSLSQPQPVTALVGAAVCASPLVYVGCMHSSRQMVTISVIAAICTGAAIGRVSHGDPLQALWLAVAMSVVLLAAPVACQVLIYALGNDAVRSDIDALTGLHNRRGFFRGTYDLIARSPGAPVAALMIDLDNFKRVNDTDGHAAGDQVIAAVAAVLRKTVGHTAVVARAGGEEFLIATTRCGAELESLAEHLRQVIEAMPATITASVGVAAAHTAMQTDPVVLVDRLVRDADTAMYTAKRSGGNQVSRAAATF